MLVDDALTNRRQHGPRDVADDHGDDAGLDDLRRRVLRGQPRDDRDRETGQRERRRDQSWWLNTVHTRLPKSRPNERRDNAGCFIDFRNARIDPL